MIDPTRHHKHKKQLAKRKDKPAGGRFVPGRGYVDGDPVAMGLYSKGRGSSGRKKSGK